MTPHGGNLSWLYAWALCTLAASAGGCHTDMQDQPRYEALEASTFFADGMSARQPVEGTIARGQLHEDEAFYTGREGQELVARLPIDLNLALLARGRERFDIYCSMCHGFDGDGEGVIVLRGLRRPPKLHIERLRNAPAGHFFDVITHGFGAMPRYAVQIEPHDRWAIVAYVRALQLSQNARLEDLPAEDRRQLEEGRP